MKDVREAFRDRSPPRADVRAVAAQARARRAAFEAASEHAGAIPYFAARTFWDEPMMLFAGENVSRHIAIHGLTEAELTTFLVHYLAPGMVFFDVGAHVGFFSLLAAALVAPAGSVVALEPTPGTFELLRRNVALQRNVVARQQAAWSSAATLQLQDFGMTCSAFNTLAQDARLPPGQAEKATAREVPVQALPLDDIAQSLGLRPDFVKIDVENTELQVIAGMTSLLRDARCVLSVEVGDAGTLRSERVGPSRAILEAVIDRGYVPLALAGGRCTVHRLKGPWEYEYDNIVLVPRERIEGHVEPGAEVSIAPGRIRAAAPADGTWEASAGFASWEGPFPAMKLPRHYRWMTARQGEVRIHSAIAGRRRLVLDVRNLAPGQRVTLAVGDGPAVETVLEHADIAVPVQVGIESHFPVGDSVIRIAAAETFSGGADNRALALLLEDCSLQPATGDRAEPEVQERAAPDPAEPPAAADCVAWDESRGISGTRKAVPGIGLEAGYRWIEATTCTLVVYCAQRGRTTIEFVYRSPFPDQAARVLLNGVEAGTLRFPGTGIAQPAATTSFSGALAPGRNVLELTFARSMRDQLDRHDLVVLLHDVRII